MSKLATVIADAVREHLKSLEGYVTTVDPEYSNGRDIIRFDHLIDTATLADSVLAALSETAVVVDLPEWQRAEELLRERDADHAWAHRIDVADVRCLVCDLRYGERQDYSCHNHTAHSYSETELEKARSCGADCPPWSRFHVAEGGAA